MTFNEILYEKKDGVARITINREHRRNAFTGHTLLEMHEAFIDAWNDTSIGVCVLTGAGDKAFCSGGDQKARFDKGGYGGKKGVDVMGLIRKIPKPVIARVNGFAIGGGQVLQMVCDLGIASEDAIFGQVGPRVGSVDPGWGTAYMARLIGERKAKEMWYLCKQYNAQEALELGLINKVVPFDKLDQEIDVWCQEILKMSPTAIEIAKHSFNCDTDHIFGITGLGIHALRLFYETEEAAEGVKAWNEKRKPDYGKYRR